MDSYVVIAISYAAFRNYDALITCSLHKMCASDSEVAIASHVN